MSSEADDMSRAVLRPEITVASLVDAMGRRHRHLCHLVDLVCPTPGRILFGPAVTISYFPTCSALMNPERYSFSNLFYKAVGQRPQGKVLVLASNGYQGTSMAGATKLSRLHNHGLAGVLTDGRLRDFAQLADYDFGAYCAGEATKWGGDSVTPFMANVPVVLGGVAVFPGQYIYADSAGAVVLPAKELPELLNEALGIEGDDRGFLRRIQNETVPASLAQDHGTRSGSETRL